VRRELLRWAYLIEFLLFWFALYAERRQIKQRDDVAARERRPTWPRGSNELGKAT